MAMPEAPSLLAWTLVGLPAHGVYLGSSALMGTLSPRESAVVGGDDRSQRAEAGRGACCLHTGLVAGAARPSRTLRGATRCDGRLGLASFLTAFTGAYLIAMTGNFGFLAPVLAKQSPAVLDSISQCSPVVIINGLAAILFMIGYVLFGVAMIRTVTLRHWSGVLAAVALRTTWRVSR
jgi:hypothetical protein